MNGTEINPGTRIDVSSLKSDYIDVQLSYKDLKSDLEIDGYAFMLDENGKVFSDNDLIFFGNEISKDGAVKADTISVFPTIHICMGNVSPKYSKIAVCFSAYGDNEYLNFTQITDPVIQVISNGKEQFHMKLNNLKSEKCLVGMEFYLSKEQWKMRCVGAGYNGKLKALCESTVVI